MKRWNGSGSNWARRPAKPFASGAKDPACWAFIASSDFSYRTRLHRNGDQMMAVAITDSIKLAVSKPAVLWKGHDLAGVGYSCGMSGPTSANYDVTAVGQRFLIIGYKAQDVAGRQLQLLPRWSAYLKRAKN